MTVPGVPPELGNAIAALLATPGRAATKIKDSPGFIAQRITAMITNPGCEMAQTELATPARYRYCPAARPQLSRGTA